MHHTATENVFTKIVKRDGSQEEFKLVKIIKAIHKAGAVTGEFDVDTAKKLARKALSMANQFTLKDCPSVEMIQDIVEDVLISSPYKKTTKSFIDQGIITQEERQTILTDDDLSDCGKR